MQEIDFFRTPFFLFKSDKKFADKISEEISDILKDGKRIDYINYGKKKKSTDKIPVKSLSDLDFNVQTSVGGFINNKGTFDEHLEDIPSQIRNHIIENIKQIGIPVEFKSVWINITSNSDLNRLHNHNAQCDLAFVLYLTKGTLWIQNPNERLKLDNVYNNVGSSISLDFNIGDMIVFPSDIYHWVEPFNENYDRITIAGNLSIISSISIN